MQRKLLKSRLNRLVVTAHEAEGEDLITLDRELLRRADIWPYEEVLIVNHTNGARFSATVAENENSSGQVRISGAAVQLARQGHVVSVMGYVFLSEMDVPKYYQRVVFVDSKNRPVG